eukprot:926038-Rhodomonas_salina.3
MAAAGQIQPSNVRIFHFHCILWEVVVFENIVFVWCCKFGAVLFAADRPEVLRAETETLASM